MHFFSPRDGSRFVFFPAIHRFFHSKGDFAPLRNWLRAKIHVTGSLYPSGDLLCQHVRGQKKLKPDLTPSQVTGKPLEPKLFLDYLTQKYSQLYGLSA